MWFLFEVRSLGRITMGRCQAQFHCEYLMRRAVVEAFAWGVIEPRADRVELVIG